MKIKITKRQLEELLGRSVLLDHPHPHNTNINVPHVDQLLISELMMMSSSSADDHHQDENINIHDHEHQRSWTPVLQTIPEVI